MANGRFESWRGRSDPLFTVGVNVPSEQRAPGPTITIGTSVENLELATLIRVSQAVSSEIVLDNLINTLMRTAIEQAGAERGVLIVPGEGGLRLEAQAAVSGETVRVHVCDQPLISGTLPESVLHYVMRTRESVMLDDAAAQSSFAADPYIQRCRSRSILLLPLLAQAKLTGALYLENSPASGVFGPARVAVVKLLASQAAIALENARLYQDLAEREAKDPATGRCEHRRHLHVRPRRSDYPGQRRVPAQCAIRTRGSWRGTHPLDKSDAQGRARAGQARMVSGLLTMGTLQPFERECFRKDDSRVPVLIGAASFEEKKHQGVAFLLDLSDRKRAEAVARESEQRYREVQMELAHANRASTMGQLLASIVHEVKQPITATIAYANAALRWLAASPPNLREARQALNWIVADSERANNIVDRMRAFFKKEPQRKDGLDINETILELIAAFMRNEARKYGVELAVQLVNGLPQIQGDRVQLQQVMLNLMLNLMVNALEAMSATNLGERTLLIRTARTDANELCVTVQDSGPGLDAVHLEGVFEAFFTTESDGLGTGLPICRAIVESH